MVDPFQLDPSRPLIICDADEVLVQFMAGLERYLHTKGLSHDFSSFRIHGNVRDQNSNDRVSDTLVDDLFSQFFATQTRGLDPVPGAATALKALSQYAQILILSNLPASARDARIANLSDHGMAYPVIAGSGPKGVVIKNLLQDFQQPVVFVDDLPPHHISVAEQTPHVHRLHFVADPRLAKLIGACPQAHQRLDTWPEAEPWIRSRLQGAKHERPPR